MTTPATDLADSPTRLFDDVLDALYEEGPALAIPRLEAGLRAARESRSRSAWRHFCESACAAHRLAEVLREDPCTAHAWVRPRGYAGDAALIDYFYRLRGADHASRLGQSLFHHTTNVTAAEAVRQRRARLANVIDDVAREKHRPIRVMAVAAGHWREGADSEAVQAGAVSELVAVDQDASSLEEIARAYPAQHKRLAKLSIARLIATDDRSFGEFDLVYAAGLYDYLDDRTAQRLTARLFSMLAPGGSLLVANLTPDCPNAAYMEAFMRWWLIYRTPDAVGHCGRALPPSAVQDVSTDSCVAYLTARRE